MLGRFRSCRYAAAGLTIEDLWTLDVQVKARGTNRSENPEGERVEWRRGRGEARGRGGEGRRGEARGGEGREEFTYLPTYTYRHIPIDIP